MNRKEIVETKMDLNNILQITIKYLIQGLIVAIVAYYVPIMLKYSLRKPTFNEIFLISVTAAISMYILDYYTICEKK